MEQDILISLLDVLKSENLVSDHIFKQARQKILDTFDWPEFFCYADDDKTERKENEDGSSENPC